VRARRSPQEFVAGLHGVHDDWSRDTVDIPDLVDDRGVVGSDGQREAPVELKDADWLS
jgi:hypothetical protein